MSAGYDGKTIIWDVSYQLTPLYTFSKTYVHSLTSSVLLQIWEGKPIRIYETGRFKLVDGKFSM